MNTCLAHNKPFNTVAVFPSCLLIESSKVLGIWNRLPCERLPADKWETHDGPFPVLFCSVYRPSAFLLVWPHLHSLGFCTTPSSKRLFIACHKSLSRCRQAFEQLHHFFFWTLKDTFHQNRTAFQNKYIGCLPLQGRCVIHLVFQLILNTTNDISPFYCWCWLAMEGAPADS